MSSACGGPSRCDVGRCRGGPARGRDIGLDARGIRRSGRTRLPGLGVRLRRPLRGARRGKPRRWRTAGTRRGRTFGGCGRRARRCGDLTGRRCRRRLADRGHGGRCCGVLACRCDRAFAGGRHSRTVGGLPRCRAGAGRGRRGPLACWWCGTRARRRNRRMNRLGRYPGAWVRHRGVVAYRRCRRGRAYRRNRRMRTLGQHRSVRTSRRHERVFTYRRCGGLPADRRCGPFPRSRRPLVRPHRGKRFPVRMVAGRTGGGPFAWCPGRTRARLGRRTDAPVMHRRSGALAVRHLSGPLAEYLLWRVGNRRWRRQIRPAGLVWRRAAVRGRRLGSPAAQRLESRGGLRGIAGRQALLCAAGVLGTALPGYVLIRWRLLGYWGLPRVVLSLVPGQRLRSGLVRAALIVRTLFRADVPVLLVAAPAFAALLRTFGFRCPVLEPPASAVGGIADQVVMRKVLYRRFVADLCDFALG